LRDIVDIGAIWLHAYFCDLGGFQYDNFAF